jgi:hypothetical protein
MIWIIIALGILALAIVIILAGVIFGCTEKFTKRLDPAEQARADETQR